MALDKLNIPTPDPKDYGIIIPQFKNIAAGKAFNAIPEPYSAIVSNVLQPPTPQDIINQFLTRMPDPQRPVTKQDLIIPQPSNSTLMDTVAGAAMNGTPLYANLEIQAGAWTGFDGKRYGFRDMAFETVLVSCQQAKEIVSTKMQGSDDGAVLEYCGLNNYDITIDIIVVGNNQNGVYPQTEMNEVAKMLKAPISLKVNSWFLQMLDIYEIVIQNFDLPQSAGSISQQHIVINALSNKTATLIIQ